MRVWREASRPSAAARRATVFPEPTRQATDCNIFPTMVVSSSALKARIVFERMLPRNSI